MLNLILLHCSAFCLLVVMAVLVEEGLHYFQLMEETQSMVLDMEHYACIVDLLGRVGRPDEALEFIHKRPIETNDMVS